jgi:hypothetical protein
LGVTHPVTGAQYCYIGLPMGGTNCPAVADRMGAAFMRLIRARRLDLFHGQAVSSTWRDELNYKEFVPYRSA